MNEEFECGQAFAHDGSSASADAQHFGLSCSAPPVDAEQFPAILSHEDWHYILRLVSTNRDLVRENTDLEVQLRAVMRSYEIERTICREYAEQLKMGTRERDKLQATCTELMSRLEEKDQSLESLAERVGELESLNDQLAKQKEELIAVLRDQAARIDKLSSTFWDPRAYAIGTATHVLEKLLPSTRWRELPELVRLQVLWILLEGADIATSQSANSRGYTVSLATAVVQVVQRNNTAAVIGPIDQQTSDQIRALFKGSEDKRRLLGKLFQLSDNTKNRYTRRPRINLQRALCIVFRASLVDCKEPHAANFVGACEELRNDAATVHVARGLKVCQEAKGLVVELTLRDQAGQTDLERVPDSPAPTPMDVDDDPLKAFAASRKT